ncbi:MAG: cell division protein FtsL [Lautropia sp.]|nr:cell division protein FtsL [Lautropia sp.]
MMMLNRINIVLAILLLISALLLVTSQNRARRLSTEMERAQGQMRELDVRFSQLQIEITRLSKPSLLDNRARNDLRMVSLTPERTIYLRGSR